MSVAKLRRISPVVPVRDVAATAAFYARHLGFETAFMMPDASYAVVARDGQAVHLTGAEGDEATLQATANNISFVIDVAEVDRLWAEVEASRPPTKARPPEDKPWGLREFHILDPDGCLLRFAQDLGQGDS